MIVARWASGVIALSTYIALTILNPVNALLAGLLVFTVAIATGRGRQWPKSGV